MTKVTVNTPIISLEDLGGCNGLAAHDPQSKHVVEFPDANSLQHSSLIHWEFLEAIVAFPEVRTILTVISVHEAAWIDDAV